MMAAPWGCLVTAVAGKAMEAAEVVVVVVVSAAAAAVGSRDTAAVWVVTWPERGRWRGWGVAGEVVQQGDVMAMKAARAGQETVATKEAVAVVVAAAVAVAVGGETVGKGVTTGVIEVAAGVAGAVEEAVVGQAALEPQGETMAVAAAWMVAAAAVATAVGSLAAVWRAAAAAVATAVGPWAAVWKAAAAAVATAVGPWAVAWMAAAAAVATAVGPWAAAWKAAAAGEATVAKGVAIRVAPLAREVAMMAVTRQIPGRGSRLSRTLSPRREATRPFCISSPLR